MMSLLSLDEPGDGRRNRHGRRSSWFAQWTRLGNSPREFHLLLTRLAELRPPARYGDTDPVLAEEVAVLQLCCWARWTRCSRMLANALASRCRTFRGY